MCKQAYSYTPSITTACLYIDFVCASTQVMRGIYCIDGVFGIAGARGEGGVASPPTAPPPPDQPLHRRV